MEQMYSVKRVAGLMGCSYDTARARMREMPGVVNVGTVRRQQLLVPESGMEDWLRNHRVAQTETRRPVQVRADGKMARMDRRTGQLKVK